MPLLQLSVCLQLYYPIRNVPRSGVAGGARLSKGQIEGEWSSQSQMRSDCSARREVPKLAVLLRALSVPAHSSRRGRGVLAGCDLPNPKISRVLIRQKDTTRRAKETSTKKALLIMLITFLP